MLDKKHECARRAFLQAQMLLSGNKIAQPMKHITNGLLAVVMAMLANFLVLRRQQTRWRWRPLLLNEAGGFPGRIWISGQFFKLE